MPKISEQQILRKVNPKISPPLEGEDGEEGIFQICPPPHRASSSKEEGYGRTIFPIVLIGLFVCLLSLGIARETKAAGVERNPFAFPPGVQKGPRPGRDGSALEKAPIVSAPSFRVTTILISGQTKVAAVNGVLLRLGDELAGYRLVEIEEKQVTLSKGKEKVVVKIDPVEKVFFKKTVSNNRVMGFSK